MGKGGAETRLPWSMESYTDPENISIGGTGRRKFWSSGSDSTGQLVRVRGMGTNASPFEGFVFGWCGGTGAAIATDNQIVIRIPRGAFNWMRIKSVRLWMSAGVGCDFTPMVGISDGAGNTDATPLGETKVSTLGYDSMVWDCDVYLRIDYGLDDSVADSMSNLLPLTGTSPHPCISIETLGYALVASLAFNFMVQLEWVEL